MTPRPGSSGMLICPPAMVAPRKGSFATFEEAHRVVLTVEAIMASSASGSWMQVADERERVA